MKLLIAVMAILLSIPASASSDRGRDEAAIRKIIASIQDAWNAGDGAAFAAPFAEDADYVVVNGMLIKGRNVIAKGHQEIFDTVYKGSHNTANVQGVRFLRDDVAIAHIEWRLKFLEKDGAREKRAMNTIVLTREGGKWSIVAFHNTPVTVGQR